MTYGLSPCVFVEDGPAAQAMKVQSTRTTARSWRALDGESRLAAIERALKPANDLIDAYPMAL
jgi:hypothetical protein